MVRLLLISVLLLGGCGPTLPRQQLPTDCRAEAPGEQLVAQQWLHQPVIWRLRQAALLEIGPKKIALEGFLRLDLVRQQARLVALNEMGLVLFDLTVNTDGEQLERAIPQLQQQKGLAQGIALSIRSIFLTPRPQVADRLHKEGSVERLLRQSAAEQVQFVFDCRGDLRETQLTSTGQDWRVQYNSYQVYAATRLPSEIIFFDQQHAVKLSLWLREARQEP